MDMLEEQLQVVLGNWSDGQFSFTGEHYQLHDLDAEPKPVQRPHPPLIVGGNAGPRSCALAARFADEYNTLNPTVSDVRERRERVVRRLRTRWSRADPVLDHDGRDRRRRQNGSARSAQRG